MFAGVVGCPGGDDVDLFGGIGRVVALDHVDHDDADVVATAVQVGEPDEFVGGGLRFLLAAHHLGDVFVADFVDEAVAAQHETVALDDRERPRVDPHTVLDAERPGDDVAAWVDACFVAADVALGDELLHVAVVDRDLAETLVTQEIGARVADVGESEDLFAEGVSHDRERGDGGAHAVRVGVADRLVEDLVVGGADGGDDFVDGVFCVVGEQFAHAFDSESAGDLAGLVAAHAVGDDEQACRRRGGGLRSAARIWPLSVADAGFQRCHYWASRTV